MIPIGVIAALLVMLFLVWKARYRYPPTDIPQALCYHKISDGFLFEGTWMTPRRFLAQIDHLAAAGYEFVDEAAFVDAVANPAPGNARKILLTFDDGYEDLYDIYVGELERRGVPLLVFLPTDYVGRTNDWDLSLGRKPSRHLTWDRITELAERGVCFGSHGASHRDLTCMSPEDLAEEVARSKAAIEERTRRAVTTLSYPFGRYNTRVRMAVREAGFTTAFSLYPTHSNETVDPFALRRNGVYIIDTPFTIDCKLTRSPLFWFEEMKCRAINQMAVLTPVLKRFSAGPGS
jgi:peptidoglycan/xylan/chitin deacetylase (PgdA/CDA1 family)